jgi:hypothetical protein
MSRFFGTKKGFRSRKPSLKAFKYLAWFLHVNRVNTKIEGRDFTWLQKIMKKE